MVRATVVGIAVALLVGCAEPVMVIPGGRLEGSVTAVPDTWAAVPETVQLETRPAKPYSVNIWALAVGRHLYVATSAEGTTWSSFIENDPKVRVRMDESIYELTATSVFDLDERRRVAAAYVTKYDVDPEDNWVAEGLILRLDRP
jgi:hypothetical protein